MPRLEPEVEARIQGYDPDNHEAQKRALLGLLDQFVGRPMSPLVMAQISLVIRQHIASLDLLRERNPGQSIPILIAVRANDMLQIAVGDDDVALLREWLDASPASFASNPAPLYIP